MYLWAYVFAAVSVLCVLAALCEKAGYHESAVIYAAGAIIALVSGVVILLAVNAADDMPVFLVLFALFLAFGSKPYVQ
jgi:hypothetical protein